MALISYIDEIKSYASLLKLNAIKTGVDEAITDAQNNQLSYEEFLYRLLQKEYDIRHYNTIQSRIKSAGFPYKKYLEDIDISALPEDAQGKLKHLNSLQFIKEGQNVILSGNPGTGKIHIPDQCSRYSPQPALFRQHFPEYILDCFCMAFHQENTDHRSFVPLFPAVDATAGLQMYQVQV